MRRLSTNGQCPRLGSLNGVRIARLQVRVEALRLCSAQTRSGRCHKDRQLWIRRALGGITMSHDEERNVLSTAIIQPMHPGDEDSHARTLPRADGGKDAWLVLAGCFVLEALVWG